MNAVLYGQTGSRAAGYDKPRTEEEKAYDSTAGYTASGGHSDVALQPAYGAGGIDDVFAQRYGATH